MLKNYLDLKQTGRLSPQQIRLMNQIHMNLQELEQAVEIEINENPALERNNYEDIDPQERVDSEGEQNHDNKSDDFSWDTSNLDDDIPNYRLYDKYGAREEKESFPVAFEKSFHERIMDQIGSLNFTPQQVPIAEFLIGSIDGNGYIRLSNQDIIDYLAFNLNIEITADELYPVTKAIQSLDPAGIGARDLQECLLLQLKRKSNKTKEVQHAIKIVDKHFSLYANKRFNRLKASMKISENDLHDAIKIIKSLNPKPGGSSGSFQRNSYVIPDFTAKIEGEEIQLILNQNNLPHLRISKSYRQTLLAFKESKNISLKEKETIEFIKSKVENAKSFINLIYQRYITLETTVRAIINHQIEYFLTGDEKKLKPLTLKKIADETQMDISTISRVTSSKYIDTPYGVKLLKYFFSEGLMTKDSQEISSYNVKSAIKEIIDSENKNQPFSDIAISNILKNKGYNIARRTITKYREQLKIPVSRLRKQLEKKENQT